MGYIKEPEGITLFVDKQSLTALIEEQIKQFIEKSKEKNKKFIEKIRPKK